MSDLDKPLRDLRMPAIGLLTALLLMSLGWHFLTTGEMQQEIAKLEERSKNRYALLKERDVTQGEILKELGAIDATLHTIQRDLAGYTVTVRAVAKEQSQIQARIDAAHLLFSTAVSDVGANRDQIITLFRLVKERG